jgi:hypothetical protein
LNVGVKVTSQWYVLQNRMMYVPGVYVIEETDEEDDDDAGPVNKTNPVVCLKETRQYNCDWKPGIMYYKN